MRKWLISTLSLVAFAAYGAGIGTVSGADRENVAAGMEKATGAERGQMPGATDQSGQTTRARSADRTAGAEATNEEVRQAQTVLRDMGLYEGEVDGIYGPRTMAAVGKFQEQNNLPRTNTLNEPTQEKLQQQATSGGGTGMPPGLGTSGTRVSPQAPGGQPAPGEQPGKLPEATPEPQQPYKSQ